MPTWKQWLLSLYYHGTYPYRRWEWRRTSRVGRAPVAVLLFHRIADDRGNDWTTSNSDFLDAIHWLESHFELISLDQAQQRIRNSVNVNPCVAITFDDGYACNCDVALPLLVEKRIPCTYFVSTGPVLNETPFEHDVQMGNHFAPNTVDQLRAFSRAGIEIGAHSRTHADIGQIATHQDLFDELVASRDDLQAALGQSIRYFAFPFGLHKNMSVAAFRLARECGYEGVCSAYGGYNYPGDDPFHLQRCGVDGPHIRLRNWATIDPIRNRRIPRFNDSTAVHSATDRLAEVLS